MNSLRDILDRRLSEAAKSEGLDWDSMKPDEKAAYEKLHHSQIFAKNKEKLEKEAADKERISEEFRRAKAREAVSAFSAKVPPKYKNASISDFNPDSRPVAHIASGNSCLMIGPQGVGKSHLIWATAKEFVSKEMDPNSVLVINLQDLVCDVKENGGSNWAKYIKREYGKVRHLFIDEFDKTYGSLSDYTIISDLVSYRYDYLLPTVIAGNGDTKLALDILGASAFSRITASAENGGLIVLKGEDRRRL